jgi:uncharacterized protein YcgI (DUF1989 family)
MREPTDFLGVLDVGECRFDETLEPVAGRAVPVYMGEVLRISQVEGGQSVDFNCFNLHDYKERMSVGHMRREGFRTAQGRFLWSNPPRFRPMMQVSYVPSTCVTDLLIDRCHGVLMERIYGFVDHPNCQDTLAESVGEYGLTPDDVHDALSFWLNSEWDHIGAYAQWNTGTADDFVDLLATMDVLAVPVICGAGDLLPISNFGYKPIRIQVFAPSSASSQSATEAWAANTTLINQRTPDQVAMADIRGEPELKRNSAYVPKFKKWPMTTRDVDVIFDDDEYLQLWRFRGRFGDTDGSLVRTLFIQWCRANRKRPGEDDED